MDTTDVPRFYKHPKQHQAQVITAKAIIGAGVEWFMTTSECSNDFTYVYVNTFSM